MIIGDFSHSGIAFLKKAEHKGKANSIPGLKVRRHLVTLYIINCYRIEKNFFQGENDEKD